MANRKYAPVSRGDNIKTSLRLVLFEKGGRERWPLLDFITLKLGSLDYGLYRWQLWHAEDGSDKWGLTYQLWRDVGEESNAVDVLVGASLNYLACWVAKYYRDQFVDVGCFVEEVSL